VILAKIAFLGNFQVDYSSETHHVKSLESLGHTVVKLQERQATAQEIYREASKCNLFIWVHTHGWKTPGNTGMDVVLAKLNRHIILIFGLVCVDNKIWKKIIFIKQLDIFLQ
jgi:hypothetical protein